VLLTTSEVTPELDVRAEESIHWTPEALERMQRVPPQVLGIARTAILRLALEQGHSVVSSDLVTEAMERFMPKRAAAINVQLAESLVLEQVKHSGPVKICAACGVAARTAQPRECQVCGGREFEVLDAAAVARIIAEEGGAEEETTYDGRRVRWTQDAKQALRAIDDRYQRRRAKARIEKAAHGRRTDVIGLELAKRFIEEETGVLYQAAPGYAAARAEGASGDPEEGPGNGHAAPTAPASVGEAGPAAAALAAANDDAELRLVARDGKDVPLLSARQWSSPAIERILRVPAGFMRDRTQQRVEALAAERGRRDVDLDLVEEGIELGKRMMEEMLGQYGGDVAAASPAVAAEEAAKLAAPAGTAAPAASACPFSRAAAGGQHDALRAMFPLDEVSVVSELERKRRELGAEHEG
jgi:hypothetical protein